MVRKEYMSLWQKNRQIICECSYRKRVFAKKGFISESDAEMDQRANAAVQSTLDRAKICKKPIAKYDSATQKAYIEYEDGVKKYVN